MYELEDALVAIPLFARVPGRDVRASAPLWSQVTIAPGDALWSEGDPADGLAVVIRGELVVRVEGAEVGVVRAGELVGEATAFLGELRRGATLSARTDATYLWLPEEGLRLLRQHRSGVYAALLSRALSTLSRRVRATDRRVGELAEGEVVAPSRAETTTMARLWKALRPGPPKSACPPLAPLLRGRAAFDDLDEAALAVLVRAFRPVAIEEGGVLFLEGEPGGAAWIVADGAIDVLRHVHGGRADLLTTLGPGDQLGVNALVDKLPRSATAVARHPGWMYRLDAEAYGALTGEPRLALDVCILASLTAQITRANAALRKWVDAG